VPSIPGSPASLPIFDFLPENYAKYIEIAEVQMSFYREGQKDISQLDIFSISLLLQ
jgi:hypothetical protein